MDQGSFAVGDLIRYGEGSEETFGEVVGFRRTRLVIRVREWKGQFEALMYVRPYRVEHDEGGAEVVGQQSLLGDVVVTKRKGAARAEDIRSVFEAWQEATGRKGTALDAKRQAKIAAVTRNVAVTTNHTTSTVQPSRRTTPPITAAPARRRARRRARSTCSRGSRSGVA